MRRIVFLHGMESSPDGTKATYLREKFGAVSPALRHLGLRQQVDSASKYLHKKNKTVVVGSSLGGLAALGLVNRYANQIAHLVLLAPAVGSFLRSSFAEEEKKRRFVREDTTEE